MVSKITTPHDPQSTHPRNHCADTLKLQAQRNHFGTNLVANAQALAEKGSARTRKHQSAQQLMCTANTQELVS